MLDEIESGRITENKICITPELVATFKENWATLVDSKIFTPTFALPFYHLKNDKFWHLVTFPGCEIAVTSSNSIRSFSALKAAVDYASFDEVLFQYLVQPDKRAMLRTILLDTYFATRNKSTFAQKATREDTLPTLK